MDDIAARYSELAKRAESGDAQAAKELYRALSSCDDIPRTQDQIDVRLSWAQAEYGAQSSQYQQQQDFLSRQVKRCSVLTPVQQASYRSWLEKAADLGDPQAKLDYVLGAAPHSALDNPAYAAELLRYRDKAKAFLNEELAAGSVDALLTASSAYGYNSLLPHDDVQQYAYLYAYVLATNQQEPYLTTLRAIEGRLSAENLNDARRTGEGIFQSCCLSDNRPNQK